MKAKGFSVVIPAYNEGKRIQKTCENIAGYLEEKGSDYEIIVVDDGSSDNTKNVLEGLCARKGNIRFLSNQKNKGKGYSVRRGVLESSGDFILFTDADLSAPICECERLLEYCENGFDVAIGSRALFGSTVLKHQPFYREYSGKIFNVIARSILPLDVRDTQCGFKLFGNEAAKRIFRKQSLNGFAFDVEVVHIARKMGYSIAEVPVEWTNSDNTGVNLFTESPRMFLDLLRIRIDDLKGKY